MSLADMLYLSRRVLRLLTSDPAGTLRRITGGFRLIVPGASVTIKHDGFGVEYWHLRQARGDATRKYVNLLLGLDAPRTGVAPQDRTFESTSARLEASQGQPSTEGVVVDASECAAGAEDVVGRNGVGPEPDEHPSNGFSP